MEFIAFFDKFAATYKQKLKQEKKNYKTFLGGLISIAVYFTSLIYLVYKIDQFAMNSLIPAQSVAFEYREQLTMETEQGLLKFQVLYSKINPFNKTNQILVPFQMLQRIGENQSVSIQNSFSYDNNEIDFENQIYSPQNLNMSLGVSDLPSKVFIGLQICNRTIHQNCADQSVIDAFFQQSGLLIRTQVTTKQYNSFEKSITSMSRNVDFALDLSQMLYQRVIMEAQQVLVDDGILFPTSQENWIYNDFNIQTQSISSAYITDFRAAFITELSISSAVQIKSIQFVKISAVLADVGSIFQSLMMVSIIMQLLNEFWMDQEIVNSVISIYYPQFQKLQFKRRFFIGPIKEIKYNHCSLDLQTFREFYQKAKDIAKEKLTVYSSVYQISRLQFAIQNLISRENFNQVHNQGIPLPKLDEALKSSRQMLIQSQTKINPQDVQVIQYEEIDGNLQLMFKDEDFHLLNHYSENGFHQSPQDVGQVNKESSVNLLKEIKI